MVSKATPGALPRNTPEKYRILSHFGHIFGGGYAAGYYSYKWAELLEADAFDKFKENGIFNKETANSFKNNILSKGNTDHPMNLFKNFMGREPDITALLNKSGINKETVEKINFDGKKA